jgi:dethiobiotin synthetase
MHCFVTGTDTEVGKTYVASLWIAGLRERGIDAVGMKPVACGSREDAEALRAASGQGIGLDEVNPVCFELPAAPMVAANAEGREADIGAILRAWEHLRSRHGTVIVEGVGGWLVPIRRDFFVADLAERMALPVVVVARNVLGTINHTLLTVESIRSRGMVCAGVVLNHAAPGSAGREVADSNAEAIAACSGVPVLGVIGWGDRRVCPGLLALADPSFSHES